MVGEFNGSPTEKNEERTMEIIHFDSPEERIAFIKGEFEEIVLNVVEKEVEKTEEKPKKTKKTAKKAKKED